MNSRFNKLGGVVLSAVLILAGTCSSHAQTTNKVYWDFSGALGSDKPTSGLITGLSTPTLTSPATLGFNATSASGTSGNNYTTAAGFAASGGTNASVNAKTGALNTASGGSTYFGFDLSLSAAAGISYTITDISLGSRQTGTGPLTLSLYESTDSFSSVFNFVGSISVSTNSTWAADNFSGIAINLPDDSSTVSLRIYGSDNPNASGGNGNWRIDDLAVTMVSAVPEPSTVALTMLGGAACTFAFRRKR